MGNMWGKHMHAVEGFRDRRAAGFKEFRDRSDPESVDRSRIVGHNGTTQQIIETYRGVLAADFETLRERLQNETYNAYTVLCAYVWRALKIDNELVCITEVILEAFKQAEELDDKYFKTDETKMPLYGLPFSVKSNFNMANYATTIGCAHLLSEVKENTCPFVQFLSDQGAIPFCLTNVPQGLLSYVASNPLYGTTKNPWDFDRTPGGSSGGEAALMAAGGSVFGIGSDLAGSLRIPAAFCGLVTLKPTQDRFVVTETHGGLPGRGRLGLSFGFYTHNVKDQEFLLRLIVGNPEYRNLCPQSSPARLEPLREEQSYETKPRIGYFVDDGFQPVAPSNRRAVEETVAALRSAGYECVEFKMSGIKEFSPNDAADMFIRNLMPDNGAYMSNDIYNGEPYDEYLKLFVRVMNLKQYRVFNWLSRYIAMPLIDTFISSRLAVFGRAQNAGLPEMRKNQENTDKYKLRWIEYWKSLGIDALICPSFITAAQEFAYPSQLSTGGFLTGLFNMLDVPAGIVPVGQVTEDDIENLDNKDVFPIKGDLLMKKQRETSLGTKDLPNSVHVVTLPNEEELCLRVMKLVESLSENVQRLEWNVNDVEVAEKKESGIAPVDAVTGKEKSEFFFKRVPIHE